MVITIDDITNLDYSYVENYLSNFLRTTLAASGRKGFVVGVSGGVDSATVYALAARSVGVDKVYALIMPDKNVTPKTDVDDAIAVVEKFGGKYTLIDISSIVDAYLKAIPIASPETDRVAIGNLRARIRMSILYYYANKLGYLVLGTGDRSEYLIGYYTKYGDGGVDVAPLTVLFKTQVRKFGEYLGVPKNIVTKPSSPRLWPGHLAEEELGMKYEQIDLVLFAYFDLGLPINQIPSAVGVDENIVKRVIEMYTASTHKRVGVLMPDPKPVVEHVTSRVRQKLAKK